MSDIEMDDIADDDLVITVNKPTETTKLKTWVEKYRPSKLDDVVYQNEVVYSLKHITENNPSNLPNLLFYGPPGTGKTSTIVALSKQMFGDLLPSRVLELNASDERGIQVIREKVKNFAQKTISTSNDIKVPSIKIIVLDECDSMTRDAQSALRRTMEKYSNTTRFCLICNYASKIIDPIVSRCTVFRFKPLHNDLIKDTLRNICQKEGFKVSDDALDSLANISEGDLRRSITLLQTATFVTNSGEEISNNSICEISGFVPQKEIEAFFNICRLKSYEKMISKVNLLIKDGYSVSQLFNQLQHWIATSDESLLNDKQKSKICQQIALNDKRLLDGCDEYVQLAQVGSCIIQSLSA